ncbi:hypothetical protein D5H75_19090 [Bailinhaonella thermotolerans]|uniref:Thioredoxin domain-containing protein n=1 Tax=Bailinhaonella thermotolerans TaxID=1070861 RepID=A0A3A4B187_9ACTN|nr:hypothetical protein D5H75_19090 [Bailinhaonella thermotolerans]
MGAGSRGRVLLVAAGVAAVLAVLAVAALGGGSGGGRVAGGTSAGASRTAAPEGSPSASPSAVPTWAGPAIPGREAALARGRADAPVMIVEFGDFTCPNCRRFAREIEPELRRRYVDTGIAQFYWRDYPALGRDSERAAIAGRAAARQGRFWEFHDAMYGLPRGRVTEERLREAATRAGLDLARFAADRKDPAIEEAVGKDFTFATRLGLPGTPAFLIDGELLFGAQPLETFTAAIEKARAGR